MSSGAFFAQVAGLALVASISPPALVLAALYLKSERPGKITAFFVAGGLFVVTVVGIAVLIAMRAGGLNHLGQHHTRYGVRLGLGLLALIAAVVLFVRQQRSKSTASARPGEVGPQSEGAQQAGGAVESGEAAKPKKAKKPKLIQRLSARPSPLTAFAVGVFMFGPSLTFISAVQVVATAKTGIGDTVGAMALIIVLAVAFAWLPVLAYLIAPARTLHLLHKLEGALAKHGRTIVVAALAAVGLYLTIQGITGLTLSRHLRAAILKPAPRRPASPPMSAGWPVPAVGQSCRSASPGGRPVPSGLLVPRRAPACHPLDRTYHPLRPPTIRWRATNR